MYTDRDELPNVLQKSGARVPQYIEASSLVNLVGFHRLFAV